jgi:eukaryotic-like serine/threonine-protein kinase
MAEVWEAESGVNGRRVALKVLTELRTGSERALERFQQEGRLAASLSSPRCVYVLDAGAVGDVPYIAMELMPGGTLADRIAEHPLAPAAAVDYVLDVLDGLESAQQAGILHRDVKPSNVFLDAAGRAKIGDFGISKSLEVDSRLSQTGAFLGTPYYASPEQIAAEPLDLRSDLYSVGAMLYELVTGALPYAGTNASQVLAQVLTRDPAPFTQHAAHVPAGLQRVILRFLAKPREKRYQSYEQARAALLPFSSRGLAVAGRGRRFGAIMIDIALFIPLGVAVGSLTVRAAMHGHVTLVGLAFPTLFFLYFTLTEGMGGASLGKRLLGLRVTTAEGATPPLWRVALRTLVFCVLYDGVTLTFQQIMGDALVAAGPLMQMMPLLVKLAGFAAIVFPMRRANGYAGLHELASGTRTVALVARERPGPVVRTTLAAAPDAAGPVAYGPYAVTGTVWRRAGRSLVVARDPELHRDVWIDVHPAADPTAPVERLRDRGAGSLTWLQRGTGDGHTWDAYGAPAGAAFVPWVERRGGLPWREMREVLDSLARELAARFERDGTAGVASPDQVWLDPSGRALLLDFPLRADAPPGVEVTPATWRDFLARVAALGFAGRGDTTLPPAVPLPLYARSIVARLGDGADAPIADFVQSLDAAATRPADVTRRRRAGPFAVLGFLPAFILLLRFAIPLITGNMPPWYRDLALNLDTYRETLARADSGAATDSAARRTAEAIRRILAHAQLAGRRTPQIEAQLLRALSPDAHAVLDTALARYPAPDSAQVAAARAWLSGRVTLPQIRTGLSVIPKAVTQAFTALAWLGAVGVVLAVALRGGVLFSLFGLVVATRDGAPAGRLRCGARALVAWSPLLGLLLISAVSSGVSVSVGSARLNPPVVHAFSAGIWERLALVGLALAGAAYAVWRPARGAAERVTGTVLVPK